MSDKLFTLITYTYITESYILVAKLEAEGINVFIKNENLVSTQQFLSNAVGGIDIQIPEKDLERASDILKELELQNTLSEKVPEVLRKEYEKVMLYCPACESSKVFRKKGSFFSFGIKAHLCLECKHTWKQ